MRKGRHRKVAKKGGRTAAGRKHSVPADSVAAKKSWISKTGVLEMFSRFIGRNLTTNRLYKVAGNLVERIRNSLQVGWSRRSEHKPYLAVDRSTSAWQTGRAMSTNGASHNKQRPNLREKCRSGKTQLRDRNDQKLKKLAFLQKRCERLKRQDEIQPAAANKEKQPQISATSDVNTEGHEDSKDVNVRNAPIVQQPELCAVEISVENHVKAEIQFTENTDQAVRRRRANKPIRTRHQTEALLNSVITGGNKVVPGAKEIKQRFSQRAVNQFSSNSIKLSQQAYLPLSDHTPKCNFTNANDWPSLAELERPKRLIKDVATELVKGKQPGSLARNTRKLLVENAVLKSPSLNSNHQKPASCSFQVNAQPTALPVEASNKTWAAVAAFPLVSSAQATPENPLTGLEMLNDVVDSNQETATAAGISDNQTRTSSLTCLNTARPDKSRERPAVHMSTPDKEDLSKLSTIPRWRRHPKQRCRQKIEILVLTAQNEKRKQRRNARLDDGEDNKVNIRATKSKMKGRHQQKWQVNKVPTTDCAESVTLVNDVRVTSSSLRLVTRSMTKANRNNSVDLSTATSEKTLLESATCESSVPLLTDVSGQSSAPAQVGTFTTPDEHASCHPDITISTPDEHASCHSEITTSTPDEHASCHPDITTSTPDEHASCHPDITIGTPDQHPFFDLDKINHHQAPCTEENGSTKQKRISVKFRALMRGDLGRVRANAVNEKRNASKKTEKPWRNKITNRAKGLDARRERPRPHDDKSADTYKSARRNLPRATDVCPYWLRSMGDMDTPIGPWKTAPVEWGTDRSSPDASTDHVSTEGSDQTEISRLMISAKACR